MLSLEVETIKVVGNNLGRGEGVGGGGEVEAGPKEKRNEIYKLKLPRNEFTEVFIVE